MERPATTGSRSGSSSTPTATSRGHQPIQTDAFRKVDSLRKTKTDAIDSVLIAEYLRFANPESSKMANPDVEQLRELARFRSFLVEQATQLKNKAIRVLDQAFPEYGKLFSNTFGEASKALLKQCPTPEESSQLTSARSRASSRKQWGNCGRAKAEAVKDAARSSIGAKVRRPCPVLRDQVAGEAAIVHPGPNRRIRGRDIRAAAPFGWSLAHDHPRIGDSLAASIAGEIGDPDRSRPPRSFIRLRGHGCLEVPIWRESGHKRAHV